MFAVSKHPTIDEIHELYAVGEATPSELVRFFLNRSRHIDTEIHAVLRYTEDLAFEQAKMCENLILEYKERYSSKVTKVLHTKDTKSIPIKPSSIWFEKLISDYPLFGIPYNLKDNILVEGEVATSASKIIEQFRAPFSATVYQRIRDKGGILISQSNLDEWAVGSSTENSAFGTTKNPYDLSRVPGGSSGGPAAVVASGQAVFSLGSDTGGSIRVPASFCHIIGLKPTYGMVSRYGVMPLSSSLDQVGPFTNTILDSLTVLNAISGKDISDQTSSDSREVHKTLQMLKIAKKKSRVANQMTKTSHKLTIGIPKEYFVEGIDPLIKKSMEKYIKLLSLLGHEIKKVSLPLTKFGLAVYYTTMTVETAANLQRYDGIRYGKQFEELDGELFYKIRHEGFGEEPKRRIMLGTFASSSGYFDAYYNSAMKVKEKMKQDFRKVFAKVDVLVCPTSPEFAFKIGEKTTDPIKMYLSDVLVYGANLTKIPAISIPMKFTKTETDEVILPAGIQIMAPEFGEENMFHLAFDIEQLGKQEKQKNQVEIKKVEKSSLIES
jgi:aspartyl-tRNA(Asn)/glutamyl-tRNA(Gln) amidotransferase subunit A